MKNKSLLLKFGAMVFAIFCFSLSSVSATLFHLNVDDMSALNEAELKKSILPIHFADNGNDFGGFFYFSNGLGNYTGTDNVSDYMYEVETTGSNSMKYNCARQVRGFYYNAERGERLWPLDQETWSGVNSIKLLETEGGLYTRCEDPRYLGELTTCENNANDSNAAETYQECKDRVRGSYKSDGNGYYGEVVQTYPKGSDQKFSFAVGVDYNTGTKFVTISTNSKLVPTFARLENKYPVGFIYDHNGGVGLVGCMITGGTGGSMKNILNNLKSPNYLSDLFYYDESEGKIKANTGVIGTGVLCDEAAWDKLLGIVIEGIVGLGEEENRNNLDIILNEKDKKMQYFSTAKINNKTLINYAKKKSAILCRGNSSTDDVICGTSIGVSTPTQRKTYIITNGDANIYPLTESQLNAGYYYDVFVMNGDLVINESSANTKFKFDTAGFVGSSVNSSYVGEEPAIASLIKGNFIVNGNIRGTGTGGKLYDKYFIYGKLTTTDSFNKLLDTFQWRCNNGVSTTESNGAVRPCPSEIGGWENPYAGASLVVIDQNYDSAFYNS